MLPKLTFLIMFTFLFRNVVLVFFHVFPEQPDKMVSKSVFVIFGPCVEVFALNGWIAGRGSLPAWIGSTRGVSLLWGLCEALWGGLLVSGCTFPIGCFCLTKTQWNSRLLKDAVSLMCSVREIIRFAPRTPSIDETLLHWWDHFTLMEPFCIINVRMVSEWLHYSVI